MSFDGEEKRREELLELNNQQTSSSSSNQNEDNKKKLIEIGKQLTQQIPALGSILEKLLITSKTQNDFKEINLDEIKKPEKKPPRVLDKTFWLWVIQMVRNNLKMGQKALNWEKFFSDKNLKIFIVLIKVHLDIDLQSEIRDSVLKEIWCQLKQITTDWLSNPNDTQTFQANIEQFYKERRPLLKDEWLSNLSKRAFGDDKEQSFVEIFVNKFDVFWNALKDGLKPGIEMILSHDQQDMDKLKVQDESLLRIERDFAKIIEFPDKMKEYCESVEEIEQMVEECKDITDPIERLDFLGEIFQQSHNVLEENKNLSEFLRTATAELEEAEQLLMKKRYNMRSVETLPFINILIGVLLNSIDQDEARRARIDDQFVRIITERSNYTIMSVNQDKDDIARRKMHIFKWTLRLTKLKVNFEKIQKREIDCTLWVNEESKLLKSKI